MTLYTITIVETPKRPLDSFIAHRTFTGDFLADTRLEAIIEAKNWYSEQLGTFVSNIKIIQCN